MRYGLLAYQSIPDATQLPEPVRTLETCPCTADTVFPNHSPEQPCP